MGKRGRRTPIAGTQDLRSTRLLRQPLTPPLFQIFALAVLVLPGCGSHRWSCRHANSRPVPNEPAYIATAAKTDGDDHQKPPLSNAVIHHVASKFKAGESTTIPQDDPRLLDTLGPEYLEWARANLKSGDICFSMSDARAVFGLFPFSRIMIKMTNSRFSHTAIVSREADGIFVYDTAPGGPRRTELATYMQLQGRHAFAVKRIDSQHADAIPAAIAYCQSVYQRGGEFDMAFAPDDRRYYCVELTQKAYASGGVNLSEPVRMDRFPHYRDYPFLTRLGAMMTDIRTDRGIFIPGNDLTGVWASPDLDLVYDNGKPGIVKERRTEASR
jgi:hypothetical protein